MCPERKTFVCRPKRTRKSDELVENGGKYADFRSGLIRADNYERSGKPQQQAHQARRNVWKAQFSGIEKLVIERQNDLSLSHGTFIRITQGLVHKVCAHWAPRTLSKNWKTTDAKMAGFLSFVSWNSRLDNFWGASGRWEILEHPSYSPGPASTDCCLLSAKKNHLPSDDEMKRTAGENICGTVVAISGHAFPSTESGEANFPIWQIPHSWWEYVIKWNGSHEISCTSFLWKREINTVKLG